MNLQSFVLPQRKVWVICVIKYIKQPIVRHSNYMSEERYG